MTPAEITAWVAASQHRLDQPNQMRGDEPNSYRKDWDSATVRMLIAASWPYFHAAGNQSIPAVYKAVNDAAPAYLCDRWYLPETARDLRLLERAGVPVFGIESKHPLGDFDVVGTSISYTVLIMSFVKHLSMSGIPLRWAERQREPANYPMVMVGGQAYCAPGPLEVIADCIFLGEVEDEPGNGGIGRVLRRIEQYKAEGTWGTGREECYRKLAREFNYLYFPRFVAVEYGELDRGLEQPSRQVCGYRALLPGMRMPFLKRFVKDLNKIKPLDNPPLLYVDPSLGAGDVEAARGCTAWCSFCRLSWVQKPQRQRSVEYLTKYASDMQLNVGSAELSPFGPDWPMVTNKKRVLKALLENVNDEVDATAMRIDDFIADHDFIALQALGGMDAATLGLEGNSQRMRDLVGKGVSDKEVEQAVTAGIRMGLRKFKLFMITNLPGEDEGDVLRIVRLGRRLADIRDQLGQPNVRIQFSWTPLLIEAQTPFQWFAPTSANHALIDVADYFRDLKIDFKIGVKAEPNKVAFFQLCQRASRDVGEAIIDVLEELDTACWGGVPRDMRERLDAALRARGFANGFADCFDERDHGDLFGWEFIDTGISRQLMWETFLQMREFCEHTDSKTYDQQVGKDHHGQEWIARCDERCMGNSCGVCDKDDLKLRAAYIKEAELENEVDLASVVPVDQTSVAVRVRARFEVGAHYRFADSGFWRHLVRRAAYRAFTEHPGAFPPGAWIAKRSIRFASDAIKFRNWAAGTDYADFGLTKVLAGGQVAQLCCWMNEHLDPWMKIHAWQEYSPSAQLARPDRHLYRLQVDTDIDTLRDRLAAWHQAGYIKMTLKAEASYFALPTEEVNAKDYADDLWVTTTGGQCWLHAIVRGRATPYTILAALLGKGSWIPYARHPAVRQESFMPARPGSHDFFYPDCDLCGQQIPVDLLESPWDPQYCPRCADEVAGTVVAALPRPQVAQA